MNNNRSIAQDKANHTTCLEILVKRDFNRWSGGFYPDSEEEITEFIDCVLPTVIDKENARSILRAYMAEPYIES